MRACHGRDNIKVAQIRLDCILNVIFGGIPKLLYSSVTYMKKGIYLEKIAWQYTLWGLCKGGAYRYLAWNGNARFVDERPNPGDASMRNLDTAARRVAYQSFIVVCN